MKITHSGSDFIIINENNIDDFCHLEKIHIIKLDFEEPTKTKIDRVLNTYKNTNRFIIGNNIKFYNDILKNTSKKYYIENIENNKLISFFRKNNKVVFNFNILNKEIKDFLLDNLLFDILKNVEVIYLDKDMIDKKYSILSNWSGNIIC